jgi:hypothetical protein
LKLFVLVFVRLHTSTFTLTTQVFNIRDAPLRNFAVSLIRKFLLTASMLGSLKRVFGRQRKIRNDGTAACEGSSSKDSKKQMSRDKLFKKHNKF